MGSIFCQILNKHLKIAKDFQNFTKVAKFCQIWSHCKTTRAKTIRNFSCDALSTVREKNRVFNQSQLSASISFQVNEAANNDLRSFQQNDVIFQEYHPMLFPRMGMAGRVENNLFRSKMYSQ